jgi:hypothetical protein
MENTTATATDNAWSGRYNPQYSQQVTAFMLNPFLKYKGLELFGTYEMAYGRKITEPKLRTTIQYAVDLLYRFPARTENFWVGGRYNSVKAELPSNLNAINISRVVGSAGWFATKNILMKAEYVKQVYDKFPLTDIRSNGEFSGMMIEAVIGF